MFPVKNKECSLYRRRIRGWREDSEGTRDWGCLLQKAATLNRANTEGLKAGYCCRLNKRDMEEAKEEKLTGNLPPTGYITPGEVKEVRSDYWMSNLTHASLPVMKEVSSADYNHK